MDNIVSIEYLIEKYESLVGPITTYETRDILENVLVNYFVSDKFDELKMYLWDYLISIDIFDISQLKYCSCEVPIIFQEYSYYNCSLLCIFIRHYLVSESRIRFILELNKYHDIANLMDNLYYGLLQTLTITDTPGCKNAIINIMRDYPSEVVETLSRVGIIRNNILINIELYCELYEEFNNDQIPFNTTIIKRLFNLDKCELPKYMIYTTSQQCTESEIKRIYYKYNLSKYKLDVEMSNNLLLKMMRKKRFTLVPIVYNYVTQLTIMKRTLYKHMIECDLYLIKQNIFDIFYPIDELELAEMFVEHIIINTRRSGELYEKAFILISKSDKVKPFDIQKFIKLYKLKYRLLPHRLPSLYELSMLSINIDIPKNEHNKQAISLIIKRTPCKVKSFYNLQNKSLDWKMSFVSMLNYKNNIQYMAKQFAS